MKKNNRGMTLVETVVAIGVLGLMATVFATSFAEVFKAQKQVEQKDRANDFSTSFARFMYTESACSSSLINQRIPGGKGEQEISLSNYSGYAAPSGGQLTAGVEVEKGLLRIKSLTLSDSLIPVQQVSSRDKDDNEVFFDRYFIRIKLTLESKIKGEWTMMAPRVYEIPVHTQHNQRVIVACHLEMKKQDACQMMGSVVNPITGKCLPQIKCEFEGHFVETTCRPRSSSAACKSIPNELVDKRIDPSQTSCPEGAAEKQTGDYSWSFTESCGKKCSRTINGNQKFYICLRCPENE